MQAVRDMGHMAKHHHHRGLAVAMPLYFLVIVGVLTGQERMSVVIRGSKNQEKDCSSLTSPCKMKEVGKTLGRVFTKKPLKAWCTHIGYNWINLDLPREERTLEIKEPTGLLYLKVPKTGSSTLAGVVDRIVWNHGMCDFMDAHRKRGAYIFYGDRVLEKSFLLGSVRDPAARALSRIAFEQVAQRGGDPTDENVLLWLNDTRAQFGCVSEGQGGFQLNYMTLDKIEPWSAFQWYSNTSGDLINKEQVAHYVKLVIKKYDFMAVVERMDESLVAFQMLTPGVEIEDLLVANSKAQGTYYYTLSHGCVKIGKIEVSPRVKEYLTSDLWYAQNYGDYLLLAAANESLDRTIDALGRKKFEKNLAKYLKLKAMVNEECSSQAFFACSTEGEPQKEKMNCYKSDHGCGYPCVDEMLTRISKD